MENESNKKKKIASIKSILGGDILATDFLQRQTKLLILVLILVVIYISNRYEAQAQQLRIDVLKKELVDAKYETLTINAELMEKSRQSRIEEYISDKKTDLSTPTHPPYLLK